MRRLLQAGNQFAQRIASKIDDIATLLKKSGSNRSLSEAEEQAVRQHLDDLKKLADAGNLDKTVEKDLRTAIDEIETAIDNPSRIFDRKMSADEAAENGLTERDPQWPWRGSHPTEDHHPLMKGGSFRDLWKGYGFTNSEVEALTKEYDTVIHRAIEESGYWRSELVFRIQEKELDLQRRLTKDEVLEVIQAVFDDISRWAQQ